MDIVERVEFEKYANSKVPAQFAMTTKAEVFSAGYRAALEASGVRELVEALEWYRVQSEGCAKITKDGDIGRNNLSFDAGKRARTALSRYRGTP